MSYWEENKDGGLGVAVILAGGGDLRVSRTKRPRRLPGNGNNLLLVKARDGVPLRYFTGAGWNKQRPVRRSRGLGGVREGVRGCAWRNPLTITVSAQPMNARFILALCALLGSVGGARAEQITSATGRRAPIHAKSANAWPKRFIPTPHMEMTSTAIGRCTTRTWPPGWARCSSRR